MLIISNREKNTSKIVIVISLVLAIYIIGAIIFTFIALPNTYINDKNVSFSAKETVIGDSVDEFEVKVKGLDDRKLNFKSQDVDYKANIPKDASLDQNPFTWPISFFTKHNYDFDYNIVYDEEKLDQIIKSSSFMENITKPQDAKLKYDGKKFIIENEVLGNEVKYDKLKDALVTALKTRDADLSLDESFYNRPERYAKDEKIKKELEDANNILKLSFKFNINGFDKKIEEETLSAMIVDENGKLTLDYDKLYAYVEKIAEETNTYGKNRKFKATDIGEITVNPGLYGFKLNVEETINAVYDAFNERKSQDIEPIYERHALERLDDGTDLGNTYIEVDLSRQHLWYYKDGEVLVSTDFVSGRITEDTPTNVGVGAVLSKERNSTLKGEDFDGSRYETPVNYWIPIGWDGEGFHDAPWRSAFGGNIYQSNGSHGCINLPPSQAQKLFELVEINTPVVVYESSTSYSPQMAY